MPTAPAHRLDTQVAGQRRPLGIIHVANLTLTPKGAGFYGVAFKLSNGLVRAGCNILNFSDRDIARASSVFRNRKLGFPGANRKLIEVADAFQPDIILFGHADTIRPDTLDILREMLPTVKLAQWNVDPLFEQDNVDRLNGKIEHLDHTFVTTAGPSLKNLGRGRYPVSFLPNPVDLSIERSLNFLKSGEELPIDLFFAAGNEEQSRSHAELGDEPTGEIIRRIRRSCPDIRFRTPGCGSPLLHGKSYDEALAATTMGLNISRRNDVYLYSSDRIAHIAGNGILAFIDRATGYLDIFDEDCFGFYSSEEELFDKLKFFKSHDSARQEVARKGWEAYQREFDCKIVAEYMIDTIFGNESSPKPKWAETY